MEFKINGDYIKLDQLLKAAGFVSSGGEAKIIINDGEILVNGKEETRRGKKIYRGDRVLRKNKGEIDITVL